MDNNLKKSHNLKLLALAVLLIITPLLSTSLRFKYLYFIVNILIIAVVADAGLFSFFHPSAENKRIPDAGFASHVAQKPVINSEDSPDKENVVAQSHSRTGSSDIPVEKPAKTVKKCSSEKSFIDVEVPKLKKCPSPPSIFFTGGDGESTQAEELVQEHEGEGVGDPSEQELFQKAETFIGNFYKELRMQREESWKKLHVLSQKSYY